MNEQELEQRMRTAVAEAPPLSFDPDRLVDTAVQRQRRWRAVLGSVAAVVVVAGSAITLTSTPDVASDSRRLPVAESQDPLPEPPDSLQRSVEQMSEYLQQRLPQVVPDATDIRVGIWHRRLAGDVAAAGSVVRFTMNGSPRLLDMQVDASSPAPVDSACREWEGAGLDRCDIDPQPDGSTLVVVETSFGDGKGKGIRVVHIRADGERVHFASGATVGEPSLTEAQLTELATDPKFGVYE